MAFSSKEDAKTFAEELLFSEKSLSDKLKEWVRYNKLSKKEITEKFYI
jgi:predicted XRE-type DNA-binding protein